MLAEHTGDEGIKMVSGGLVIGLTFPCGIGAMLIPFAEPGELCGLIILKPFDPTLQDIRQDGHVVLSSDG